MFIGVLCSLYLVCSSSESVKLCRGIIVFSFWFFCIVNNVHRVFCLRCVQVLVLLRQLTDFHWCFVFLVILNLNAQANVQGGNGKSRDITGIGLLVEGERIYLLE